MLPNSAKPKAPNFVLSRKLVISPKEGSPWASEMVLNPAIIEDPVSGRLHMLFRATGPFAQKQIPGRPLPFPIFLGYAWSDDRGASWTIDFENPALAPRLGERIEDLYLAKPGGQRVVNHANGCIEDPRLFRLGADYYLSAACRMFPPGPYWLHDEPMQCAPEWAAAGGHAFGRAASENVTVNVLFRVDLKKLGSGRYEEAFEYVTHLTDPALGENRDVILFPEKLEVNGRSQYVCLHRPWQPGAYSELDRGLKPSILVCASERLDTLWCEKSSQTLLASPLFDWELERVGASGPLVKLSSGEWLLSYHGKKSSAEGYTQSFMILETTPGRLPTVKHRCPDRLLVPEAEWEMPNRFKSPVIFITGMIVVDGRLLVSYGAADERVGIAWLDFEALISHVRRFDAQGR